MDKQRLKDVLSNIGLTDETTVSDPALARMVRIHKAGDVIIREGDASSEFFIIVRGTVDIIKNMKTINEKKIASLRESEILGEMTYFDNKRRSASGVAATDTTLLVLDNQNFEEIQKLFPELVNLIIKSIACRIVFIYSELNKVL